MSIAVATMVQRVKDVLLDNPWATTITGSYTAGAATIPVVDGTRWDEGAVLEFALSGAQYWVISVSANNLTVIPNWNGTTSVNESSGALVYRDPTFPYFRIKSQIEDTVRNLWPHVYKKVTASVTPVNGTYWYNLSATALGLIAVQQLDAASKLLYQYGHKNSRMSVGFGINVPTTLAASNTGIYFPRGFFLTTTNIQVDYAAKLTAGITTTNYDDWSEGTMADMIATGAAASLLSFTENYRVSQEDIGMGDSSVQPGARARGAAILQGQFLELRNIVHEELRRTIPIMGELRKPSALTSSGPYGGYSSAPPWS